MNRSRYPRKIVGFNILSNTQGGGEGMGDTVRHPLESVKPFLKVENYFLDPSY